jgi:CheY-like chemotaxis protein
MITRLRRVMDDIPLVGRCILLVEDEPLISLDIQARLEAAGAHVRAASRLDRALTLASRDDLSAGVLDFNLGNADSTLVCWKLFDRGIPFLFHTGRFYTAFRHWPSARVIFKTANQGLIGTITGLLP